MSYSHEQILLSVTAYILGLHANESIRVKFDAACDVLQDIRVNIARRLNGECPDPLSLLPSEIHAKCFETLGLRDRVVASQVCSRWRDVAVANRQLWTEINLDEFVLKKPVDDDDDDDDDDDSEEDYDKSDDDDDYENTRAKFQFQLFRQRRALETCFSRAGALSIRLMATEIPLQISEIIWNHIDRFSHVLGNIVTGTDGWRPDHSAPRLVQLHCTRARLLNGFGGHLVPCLRLLLAQELHIPREFSPVYTLRSLSCGYGVNSHRIFVLFPNLLWLRLEIPAYSSQSVSLPSRLPQSLRELRLHNGADLSRYIRQWSGAHSLREFHVSCVTNAEAIVAFFLASIGDSPFEIRIASSVQISRPAVELRPHRRNLCKIFIQCRLDDPAMQPLYDRTISLKVPCAERFIQPLSTMVYPSMTELVVRNEAKDSSTPFAFLSSCAVIRAPELRRLTFRCRRKPKSAELTAGRYPKDWDIRRLVSFTAQKLDCFTINVHNISVFKDCDMTAAFEFAKEVVCCTTMGDSTLIRHVPQPATVQNEVNSV